MGELSRELMRKYKALVGIKVEEETDKMINLNISIDPNLSNEELGKIIRDEIDETLKDEHEKMLRSSRTRSSAQFLPEGEYEYGEDQGLNPFSLDHIEHLTNQRMRLLKDRGERYSTHGHITQNFEDVARIANTLLIHVTPYDVAMILAILKMVRDANGRYRGEGWINREDHHDDKHNYLDLALLCDIKAESEKNQHALI